MTTALLGLTVALLPLLVPSGPGNSAPVDAAAVMFLLAAFVALVVGRRPIRTPAVAALGAIVAVSLVATAASRALGASVLSLSVELYLLLLFWTTASVLDGDRRRTRKIMTIWALSALGWAVIVLGAHFKLLPAGLGELLATTDHSGRTAGAAKNPNLAASYLVTSLFVLLATPRIPRLVRLAAAGVIIWAVVVTGSNGALLALAAGLVVVGLGAAIRAFAPVSRAVVIGAAAAAVTIAAALVVVVSGPPQITTAAVSEIAASQANGPLDKSVGRLDNSVGVRLSIWSRAWSGGSQSILTGIGPAASHDIEVAGGGQLNKGLHDDYIAFLLERGIGGAAAFVCFVLVLLRWAASLLVSRIPDHPSWAVGGLGGGIVATLVMAMTHESFHFRHLWLLFALAWVCRRLATSPELRPEVIPQPTPSSPEESLEPVS